MLTEEDYKRIEQIQETREGNMLAKANAYRADIDWLLKRLRALDNKLLEHEMNRDPNGEHAQEVVQEVLKVLTNHGYWLGPMGAIPSVD